MSLRAKVEAVIYAAEEPVTLAQLAVLFAPEALDARAERLGSASPGTGEEPDTSLFEQTNRPQPTAETAADEHAGRAVSDAAIEQAVEHPEQVAATGPDGFAGELEAAADPSAASEPSSSAVLPGPGSPEEEKRLARLRDRAAREELRRVVDELIAEYDQADRGMEIREIAGGYRVATKPEYHDAVRGFIKSLKPPMKLSLQALETLAVIAYKQPVTAPEVSEIRGVDSGGVLGSLISRKLVTTAGRKQVIGRPILYKTTKEFLLRFGLKDLAELPSMEEFEKMAGELVESDAASQLDLPRAELQLEPQPISVDEEEPLMQAAEPEQGREASPDEQAAAAPEETQKDLAGPSDALDVLQAPELAEEREDEELAAQARAAIQVDNENERDSDLPGVTRDTAGRVNIDSPGRPSRTNLADEDF